MLGAALEWLSFGSSMLCVFCYGHSKLYGAIIGVVTALLFIAMGIVTALPAAVVTNVVFVLLHIRNLRRALSEPRWSAKGA